MARRCPRSLHHQVHQASARSASSPTTCWQFKKCRARLELGEHQKVSSTLQPMGDVVTEIESCFQKSVFLCNSFCSTVYRHNQILAHVLFCNEHLDSGLTGMMLRIGLSVEERKDTSRNGVRRIAPPPRVRLPTWLLPQSSLHRHQLVVKLALLLHQLPGNTIDLLHE